MTYLAFLSTILCFHGTGLLSFEIRKCQRIHIDEQAVKEQFVPLLFPVSCTTLFLSWYSIYQSIIVERVEHLITSLIYPYLYALFGNRISERANEMSLQFLLIDWSRIVTSGYKTIFQHDIHSIG